MVGRRVEELVATVLVLLLVSSSSSSSSTGVIRAAADDDQLTKDKQECAPQLTGLSPCLSYVQGTDGGSKTPTADCCQGLKTVLKTSKKCLCLLVKYRNDPSLGLKIDANRALGLPAVCHAPASITECPSLLHLAPNSPDAKVFDDFAKAANATSSSSSSSAAAPSSANSTTAAPSDGGIRVRPLPLAISSAVLADFLLTLAF